MTVARSTMTEVDTGLVAFCDGRQSRLVADGNTINGANLTAFGFAISLGEPSPILYTANYNVVGFKNNIVLGRGTLTPIGTH